MFNVAVVSVFFFFCLIQGFGDVSGEHWLGNDIIHRLTRSQEYSLHVHLRDKDGNEAYSHYDLFYIDEEEKNYRYFSTCTVIQIF